MRGSDYTQDKPTLRGISHAVGAVCAVPALVALILHARSTATLAASVFGAALLALLTISGVYHTPDWQPTIRKWLRRVDHSMIYVLIAASYTPFCLAMGGTAHEILLPAVWVAAGLGIMKSMVWPDSPKLVTAIPYVLLGWCMVPYAGELAAAIDPVTTTLIMVGGLMYTLGALAYAFRWPNPAPTTFGYHEIFHLLVVCAGGCHYAAVWRTVG